MVHESASPDSQEPNRLHHILKRRYFYFFTIMLKIVMLMQISITVFDMIVKKLNSRLSWNGKAIADQKSICYEGPPPTTTSMISHATFNDFMDKLQCNI